MATPITAQPTVLKNVILSLSAVGAPASAVYEHESAVDQVLFTPSFNPISWAGLNNNTFSDASIATWTVTLEYVQDWKTPNSLSAFLFNNEGQQKQMIFKPVAGDTPTWTATVVVSPGAVGGNVNEVALATVTLQIVGKPVLS